MRPKTKVIGNKKKRKKRNIASYSTAAQKKSRNQKQDPLQSFSYEGEDAIEDSTTGNEVVGEDEQRHPDGTAVRPTTTEHGTTGRHKEWQRRHKKGVYSKRFKNAQKKKKRKAINAGHVNAKDVQHLRS